MTAEISSPDPRASKSYPLDKEAPSCGCCGPRRTLNAYALALELKALHKARKTSFDPDGQPSHERLLHMLWRALKQEPYQRTGPGWKEIGFQGEQRLKGLHDAVEVPLPDGRDRVLHVFKAAGAGEDISELLQAEIDLTR